MKYSNIIITILVMILLSCGAYAETVKLGNTINITQGCAGSTYSNISQIKLNGQLISSSQIAMTATGGGSYAYAYTPPAIGEYYILTHCNENGVDINAPFSFTVSPSGYSPSGSNIGLFIIVALIIYSIAFIGFFGKNEWVCILGGMGMLALGIYTINNGIIIYKDFITNIFSWTTIGLGAFFALFTTVSLIQDNYN